MKTSIISLAAVAILAIGAVSAHAENYLQVGATDTVISGYSYGTAGITAGHTFTPHIAVEASADVGLTSKKLYGVDTKVDYSIAAYTVGIVPLTRSVDFLVRAGGIQTQVQAKYAGDSATVSANGPAIGIGLRYFPGAGANGVRGDVTHYDFGNKGKGEIYQVAYVRKF